MDNELSFHSFSNWLYKTTELHENSIYRYVNAVKIISESKEISSFGDFFKIINPEELLELEKVYFSNPENERKNTDGNNMYSAAFHHYQNYIKELSNPSTSIDQNQFIESDELNFLIKNESFNELQKKYYLHLKNERKTSIIKKAKMKFMKEKSFLYCERCNFNKKNDEAYGEKIIEGHHLLPIENLNEENISKNTISNIMLLCPICHKTVHIFMSLNNLESMTREEIVNLNI